MNKQIALAYGVAGLAVAIAFVTVVWTTVGFSQPGPEVAPYEAAPVGAQADLPSQQNAATVVYVDEAGNPVDPRLALASTGGDDDRWEDEDEDEDEDDEDEDEDEEEEEDDEDDDDRRPRRDRDDD